MTGSIYMEREREGREEEREMNKKQDRKRFIYFSYLNRDLENDLDQGKQLTFHFQRTMCLAHTHSHTDKDVQHHK